MKKYFNSINKFYILKRKQLLQKIKSFHGFQIKKITLNENKIQFKGKLKISQKLHLVCAIAIGMNVLLFFFRFWSAKIGRRKDAIIL